MGEICVEKVGGSVVVTFADAMNLGSALLQVAALGADTLDDPVDGTADWPARGDIPPAAGQAPADQGVVMMTIGLVGCAAAKLRRPAPAGSGARR
jgi:hypothetical protein